MPMIFIILHFSFNPPKCWTYVPLVIKAREEGRAMSDVLSVDSHLNHPPSADLTSGMVKSHGTCEGQRILFTEWKSQISDSNRVWYCSFWSEVSINCRNLKMLVLDFVPGDIE